MAAADPASRAWTRLRAVLIALVLARGLVWLCVLPPFEGWDEYQHVGYLGHLVATGTKPEPRQATIPERTLAAIVASPQPQKVVEFQLAGTGAVDYDRFWDRHDPGRPGTRPPAFVPGRVVPLYQSQHGPLSYRLVAPLYRALGGESHILDAVAGLRALNVVLTAVAVAIALGVFRRCLPSRLAAGLAGLVLATHPLFLMNGARVANDAMGVVFAVAAVSLGLGVMEPEQVRGFRLRCLGLGVATSLSIAAKASNLALLPFVAFCGLVGARRAMISAGEKVVGLFLIAATLLLGNGPEIGENLLRFGSPTTMQEALMNRESGRSLGEAVDAVVRLGPITWTRRLWTRELFFAGGWTMIRSFPPAIQTYQITTTAALLGWPFILAVSRERGRRFPIKATHVMGFSLMVTSYSLALLYHAGQSMLAWGSVTTNPWYACPALPFFLSLTIGGALAWPRIGCLIPLTMAGAGIAIEFVAITGSMLLAYTGGATGWEALHRLAALRPAILGTPTLLLGGLSCLILFTTALVLLRDLDVAECGPRPPS